MKCGPRPWSAGLTAQRPGAEGLHSQLRYHAKAEVAVSGYSPAWPRPRRTFSPTRRIPTTSWESRDWTQDYSQWSDVPGPTGTGRTKTGQGKPTSKQQQHHLVTSLTLTACGGKPGVKKLLDGPVGKPAGTNRAETGEATGQWPEPWPEPTGGKTEHGQQLGNNNNNKTKRSQPNLSQRNLTSATCAA